MKYPQSQFKILKEVLTVMKEHFEIDSINPTALHYTVYQNGSEGQTHNWLYINNTTKAINRKYSITDFSNYSKLLNVPIDFELYPIGCNDNHVETAVKTAVKEIKNS